MGYQEDQPGHRKKYCENSNPESKDPVYSKFVSLKEGKYENCLFQNFTYHYEHLIPGYIYLHKIATL